MKKRKESKNHKWNKNLWLIFGLFLLAIVLPIYVYLFSVKGWAFDTTDKEIDQLARANIEKENAEKELQDAKKRLLELQADSKNVDNNSIKEKQRIIEKTKIEIEQLKINLSKKIEICKEKSKHVNELSEKSRYAKSSNDAKVRFEQINAEFERTYNELNKARENLNQSSTRREKKRAQSKIKSSYNHYSSAGKKYESAKLREEKYFNLRYNYK